MSIALSLYLQTSFGVLPSFAGWVNMCTKESELKKGSRCKAFVASSFLLLLVRHLLLVAMHLFLIANIVTTGVCSQKETLRCCVSADPLDLDGQHARMLLLLQRFGVR